jgi:hypothetical protein
MRKHGWIERQVAGMVGRCGGRFPSALISGLALAASGSVEAATIVAYDGANSPTTAVASEWLAGVTPLDLSRGAGLNAGSGGTFNSSGWTDEATDYLEWGWSASQPIDLIDLDLRYDRSGSGPSVVDIQLSVNGGAFSSIFNDPSVDEAGEDVLDVDLTSYTAVTSAMFRLFGSGASSGTGTFDLEPMTGVTPAAAILVSGLAAPVPEPSTQSLALLAGLCLLVARRRPRRA